jgi:hypothetical protein
MEIEKLKKERLEREHQKQEQEQEKEFQRRINEAEFHNQLEKQLDSFHYNQLRLRSKIRITEGRAKPIDLLAHYINQDDDGDLAVQIHEPTTYLNGLTIRDLEHLLADIKLYTDLEQQQKSPTKSNDYHQQYWKDIITITEDQLIKLKKLSSQLYHDQTIHDTREGINTAVLIDLNQIFRNKTPQQLEQLEQRIRYFFFRIDMEKKLVLNFDII